MKFLTNLISRRDTSSTALALKIQQRMNDELNEQTNVRFIYQTMYYANRRRCRAVDRRTVAQRCLLLTADLHSCMILARMILCHMYITCTYTRYFPFDSSIRASPHSDLFITHHYEHE